VHFGHDGWGLKQAPPAVAGSVLSFFGATAAAAGLLVAIFARLHAGRHARAAVKENGVLVDSGKSDEGYHLAYISAIRAAGHRLPKRFPQFVGPGVISYPGGYHWVLSFLPDRAITLVARYGGLATDLVLGGAVSGLLIHYAHVPGAAAIAILALYLASPALTLVNIGPRSFHLTPRLPSQMLYGWIVILVIAARGHPSPAVLVLVTVLLAALLLTSKFALQVALFAVPTLMLSGRPLASLGCFVSACILAAVVSRGFFVNQVRGQLEHLEWYVKRHRQHMFRANVWGDIASRLRAGDRREAVRLLVLKDPLTAGVLRHVHIVALAGWLIVTRPALTAAQSAAAAFTVAGIVGWVATSAGALRVLGESERYLEFALPASWFLFWSLPQDGALLAAIAVALIYETVCHVGNLRVMRGRRAELVRLRAELNQVLRQLSANGPATLLFLNVVDTYALRDFPALRAVMYSGSLSLRGEVGAFLDWFCLRYPLVHPSNMAAIVERYGVDFVIFRRDKFSQVGSEGGLQYDFAAYPLRFANSSYAVYGCPIGPPETTRPDAGDAAIAR
jgi:hypothetical protein